ncbi:MAG TPA: hypothetical protein VGO35_10075 [Gammaproteobacteria bacterium]|jgi:hypothetical protein|nr:hypothetical protein [Gammaproteobacteria bacterium]
MDIQSSYVYIVLALIAPLTAIIVGGFVIGKTPDEVDLETRKVRFAAAMFTGILTLFIFAAVLYFAQCTSNCNGSGQAIFDKAMTAMTPLAGAIIGYLFGTRKSTSRDSSIKEIKKK